MPDDTVARPHPFAKNAKGWDTGENRIEPGLEAGGWGLGVLIA